MITINVFDPASIDKAIKELERLQKRLKACEEKLVTELLDIGEATAQPIFDAAPVATDGDPTVHVWTEKRGNNGVLHAEGSDVGFIEFGTGIYEGQGPTLPRPAGWDLGGYGQGKGSRPPWVYKGGPGPKPPPRTRQPSKRPGYTLTHGNKPAGAMLRASEDMQDNAARIAKEALSK